MAGYIRIRASSRQEGECIFLVTRAGFCAVLSNDMANTPVLTDEQWEALRLLSIKGVSDTELAERFQVDSGTIRQKRHRDEVWKAAWEGIRAKGNELSQKGAETAFLAKKVASTISENVSQLSDSNLLLASQIARKGLQRASGEIEHLAIENIADIERIFKMAAIAGKWNQPQVSVNQAFAFGGGQDDGQIVECETEIVEDAGNYGDAFNLEAE